MDRNTFNKKITNFKKGNKKRIIKFLSLLKVSISNSKELRQIFKNAIENKSITEEENKIIRHHIADILKTLGLSSLFILPFGSLMIILIIRLSEDYNMRLLPESLQLVDKEQN